MALGVWGSFPPRGVVVDWASRPELGLAWGYLVAFAALACAYSLRCHDLTELKYPAYEASRDLAGAESVLL